MFWVPLGFVLFGIALGAALRVPSLIAVLLAATAVVAVSDIVRCNPNVFIGVVIVIVALQVGYVSGLSSEHWSMQQLDRAIVVTTMPLSR
jgi:hypothetical protein